VLKNYFYYLKTKLIFFARHLFKIKLKIWKLRKSKINFYKQIASNVQKTVVNTMFFKNDIPKHIEVDFSILMLVIIFDPKIFHLYNKYLIGFITNYMYRLYIWNR
jgi:hypothetical protein